MLFTSGPLGCPVTGERWPDKRARAVLFAGARRLPDPGEVGGVPDPNAVDPDALAELGLLVRERLFVDAEVREDLSDPKAHRIGYSRDCMQFATLEPTHDGIILSLWLDPATGQDAASRHGASEPDNAFRRLYGWKEVQVRPGQDLEPLAGLVNAAVAHAQATKQTQAAPRGM